MNEQGILLESGTNELELLAVLVNDQLFGMNVAKVQSIQQFDKQFQGSRGKKDIPIVMERVGTV